MERTKRAKPLQVRKRKKDYSAGESSPYQEWVEKYRFESIEANPDLRSAGLYSQDDGVREKQQDLILQVFQLLSPRELAVAKLIMHDRTYQEMADELGVTVGAVQSYIERIREKVAESALKIE